MKLLTNEEKIVSSNADKIILTNYRVRMEDQVWGRSYAISIFLENISSIEVKYMSNIAYIIAAIISVLIGLYLNTNYHNNDALFISLILGVIFIAIWAGTKKHVISISSDGGSAIKFRTQRMSHQTITDFIHKLSQAKLNRVNQISLLQKVE